VGSFRFRIPRHYSLLAPLLAFAAAGFWYTSGGAVWFAGRQVGAWPMVFLLLMWPLHWAISGFRLQVDWSDGLLALFLVSALIGVWTAYDRGPAWAKFWLIVGAVGLYYAYAHQRGLLSVYLGLALLGGLGIALAGYFFCTANWNAQPPKYPALIALGRSISGLLPRFAAHRITPNVTGGLLALLMPVYVPLFVLAGSAGVSRRVPRWLVLSLRGFWVAGLGIVLLAWLVSSSRGAWLATAGVAVLWGLWRVLNEYVGAAGRSDVGFWRRRVASFAVFVLAGALTALLTLHVLVSFHGAGATPLLGRLAVWRDASLLARDYLPLGVGLGAFQIPFSIYTLLIHVGYIVNSHNLFLDVLVEQGIVGLSVLLGMIVWAICRALQTIRFGGDEWGWLTEAGLAMMGVILLHGMVDDIVYGSRGVILLFVPFGLVAAAWRATAAQRRAQRSWRMAWAPALGLLLALGLVVFWWWRPLAGQWHACLGAIAQTRIELSAYDPYHFSDPTLDQVRRTVDLAPAIRHYEAALAWDPGNVTARQRLGGILLSRGQYDRAFEHLQRLWDDGHRDAVTRLLLGDALVAMGQVDVAVQVVRGLRWAKSRLEGQAWSRYQVYGDTQRARYAWQAASSLSGP